MGGLPSGTVHHWRLRLRYHSATTPFQGYSRWLTIPWNGWQEADLRTQPCPLPQGIPALSVSEIVTGTAHLTWPAVTGATAFDIVRGNLSTLHAGAGDFNLSTSTCVANNLAATATDDPATPPAGDGFWHLVRAVNRGAGTYDSGGSSQAGSRDLEIASSAMSCP